MQKDIIRIFPKSGLQMNFYLAFDLLWIKNEVCLSRPIHVYCIFDIIRIVHRSSEYTYFIELKIIFVFYLHMKDRLGDIHCMIIFCALNCIRPTYISSFNTCPFIIVLCISTPNSNSMEGMTKQRNQLQIQTVTLLESI